MQMTNKSHAVVGSSPQQPQHRDGPPASAVLLLSPLPAFGWLECLLVATIPTLFALWLLPALPNSRSASLLLRLPKMSPECCAPGASPARGVGFGWSLPLPLTPLPTSKNPSASLILFFFCSP